MNELPVEWRFNTNINSFLCAITKSLKAFVSGSEKAYGPGKYVEQGFVVELISAGFSKLSYV